jgi:MFS family permease
MATVRRLLTDTFGPLRQAMANDGIRRVELAWAIGIAADSALLVVLLVEVYARDGVVATGLLGAVRMVPAVLSGMLSGAALARFRGDRILLAIAITRTASAVACALALAMGGSTLVLFVIAAVAAAAGAPVRPTQATLMPALARSPDELIAANAAWTTGEGLGAFGGPLLASLLIAAQLPALAALAAGLGFLVTAAVVAGLRFEQAGDSGGTRDAGGLRLGEGIRALGRRTVPRWAMLGVFGQVMTRGLLNSLVVVGAVELLGLGDPGVGLLNAALGLGTLLGAVFAMSLVTRGHLVRAFVATLAYWGAPIALIGLLPNPAVAVAAMAVVGLANAAFDVTVFTIFQRGCANDERGPVFSVFEGVAGLGLVTGSLLGPALVAEFGNRGAFAVGGAILPIMALVIYSRVGRLDQVSVVDEETVHLLRKVPAFAELPLTAVERLVGGLIPASYPSGSVLMRQGEPGSEFIVIEEGTVEILVDGRSVQRLGPVNGVGDVALVRRSPRTATVLALTDVAGYRIDCTVFLAAISGPAAAAVTERIASAHLARSSEPAVA